MSDKKRRREKEDRRDQKRHKSSKQDLEKLKTHAKKLNQEVQQLKHVETLWVTLLTASVLKAGKLMHELYMLIYVVSSHNCK